MYDMARELHADGVLSAYHSGNPGWRLKPPDGFPLRAHPARTLVTYGLNRLPSAWRPDMLPVFRWQDQGFDRAVARSLERADFIHALPGQALQTFRRAGELGICTVLNHASGPVWRQNELVALEYERTGQTPPAQHRLMPTLEKIHRSEYELADFHCVASSVVRDQLIGEGIEADRIWVIPYGADSRVFHSTNRKSKIENRNFQIVFAGQLVLRKGIKTLLDAMEILPSIIENRKSKITMGCYGPASHETEEDFFAYNGAVPVRRYGVVSRAELAEVFRGADLLVLPSWEEAFGLVVPQALACGCPCVVSDRVGAKDLIVPRRNGSVFAAGDALALAGEIAWWMDADGVDATTPCPWGNCAGKLTTLSKECLHR